MKSHSSGRRVHRSPVRHALFMAALARLLASVTHADEGLPRPTGVSPVDLFTVQQSRPLEGFSLGAGAVTQFSRLPGVGTIPRDDRVGHDLQVGGSLWGYLQIDVALPVRFYLRGPAGPGGTADTHLQAGLDGLRLTGKIAIPGVRRRFDGAGLGVALLFRVESPTAVPGARETTWRPGVVVDRRWVLGRGFRVLLAGNLGVALRQEDTGPLVKTSITYGVAAKALLIPPWRVSLFAGVDGALGVAPVRGYGGANLFGGLQWLGRRCYSAYAVAGARPGEVGGTGWFVGAGFARLWGGECRAQRGPRGAPERDGASYVRRHVETLVSSGPPPEALPLRKPGQWIVPAQWSPPAASPASSGAADRPRCDGAVLARRQAEGFHYGQTLSEAADTAATLEGGHPDDFNFVPESRRRFLKWVGERSWAVDPPRVTIADEEEVRCFIAGVNDGIATFERSELFWGKVTVALRALSIYLSAQSIARFAVTRGGGGRTPPRLTVIRGGGSGAPPLAAPLSRVTAPRPVPVITGSRGPAAAAVVPAPAPVVAPVTPLRPRPTLVHSRPMAQPVVAPVPTPIVPPAIGVAAATAAARQPEKPDPEDCIPKPMRHRGGNDRHNRCADMVPGNAFPGSDVVVNKKWFDALQHKEKVLWEIKTDNYSSYSDFLLRQVIKKQLPDLWLERNLAKVCGFDFVVGVTDAKHLKALRDQADAQGLDLKIILIQCH